MSRRVALVTGGSSGIGEQTALGLHKAGFEVYAVARRFERMAALQATGVHTFTMDVTDDASMVAGVERVIGETGRIDVLVNNAGYGSYGAVEDVPIDGMALNITCTSYDGNMCFGLTGSRRTLPHLQRLLTHLDDELTALEKAAGI